MIPPFYLILFKWFALPNRIGHFKLRIGKENELSEVVN